MIILFSLVIASLALLMMGLNYMLSTASISHREKSSIFECGFDPKGMPRLPFSTHFFLIALIFLIFDVEISLLVPLPYSWALLETTLLIWTILMVLAILILGALVEWLEGSLSWNF